MKNSLFKKGIALIVIVLFIGASIIPLTGSKTVEKPSMPTFNRNILYVGGSGPNNYSSIQAAIDAANISDTIYVYNGTYHESVSISKTINLIGEDKNTTIISTGVGDVIEITADNVYVSGFTLRDSINRAGIDIHSADNNTITDNIMYDNNQGINLLGSKYNYISGNIFENNNHGIYLWPGCIENIFTNNTIFSSVQCGIVITNTYSYDNIFYHNVFYDSVSIPSYNIWDNGYPSGGNYWDGYQGTDGNGDGIGDTPYVINANNIDRYPLGFFYPIANFTYSINDLTVQFNASESRDPDPDGYITSYNWNFGDNNHHNGTEFVVNHTYSEYGTYQVTLKVIDNHGKTDSISKLVSTGNRPPNIPSNPNPSDDATGVPINAVLSWSGGDPDAGDTVAYDVYFGTTSLPPLIVHNQSEASYDPGILDFETTYYWQIVAWDNHGESTPGQIWDFTTGNSPLYEPGNPNPFDGEMGVSIYANLSWTGGGTPGTTVMYDVYFGTTSPPPQVVWEQSGTTYDPGRMNGYTQFYWQIVARDNYGNFTSGPIWGFFTEEGPMIVSIQPSTTTVEPGETFWVSIYIEPGEPIIGAHVDYLYFDPDLLQVTDTSYDGFFYPQPPPWWPPPFDNVNGYVYDMSELGLGPDGWSNPGPWVTIVFEAQQLHGTSYLNLSGVIVSDVNGEVAPLIINDGIVNIPMDEDVNMDHKVHFMDLVAISLVYGDIGTPGWCREDVDNNGEVHFMDLVQVSQHYNEEW